METLAGAADCRLRRKMMEEVNAVRLAAYDLYGVLAELTFGGGGQIGRGESSPA